MSTLDDVRSHLKSRALVVDVDELPKGHIRIETTFKYPDGGSIELFVVSPRPSPPKLFVVPPRLLTDLGQTTAWLLDLQIKPWLSKKRQAMVEDVLHVHRVRQNGGAFEVDLASLDELESKVLALAQVCLRVADLTFTRRASLQAAFTDDLEEVFVDTDLEYEPNVELKGRFGSTVRVDYVVHGPRRKSALMGWSSGSSSQAHVVANEIFRKWYDLDVPGRDERRVTVFDDRYDVFRPEDMERISSFSDLLALSDKKALGDALTG
jgi:Domain of unknown function DUF1828